MFSKIFSRKITKLLIVLAVCILLIFFIPKNVSNSLRGTYSVISYPFQKTFSLLGTKIQNTTDFLSSIYDLKRENEELLRENRSLSSEIAQFKEMKRENSVLREQINLAPRNKFNLEASFIIGRDPQRFESWILIDKGVSSGISPGMGVIISDGIIVGKVSEVHAGTSKVDLLTNPSSVVNVIDVDTNARGVIRGEYGLGIIMDMVDQNDILNPGDTITTSGLGKDLTKGLFIGKVQEVRSTEDKLFQQAIVSTMVKYSNLDIVFVVKK